MLLCSALCVTLYGCSDDMAANSRVKPLAASSVFPDGRSSRPLVADTVAQSDPVVITPYDSGMYDGKRLAETFPVPLTRSLIDRGEQRFNIYCSPCHGMTGYGDGMIVQRGFQAPPSFHTKRLLQAPIGHFFDVVTNGYGNMYSYNDRVAVADRWAIIAYIRVLQRSQNATIDDVPIQDWRKLEGSGP